MIDWSIRTGDLISLFGFLVGGAVFFFGLRQRIELVAQRLGFLEDTYKRETDAQNHKIDTQSQEISKLGELLIQMGRYEERMLHYDERFILMKKEIEDLRHGQGFINGPRLANAGIP